MPKNTASSSAKGVLAKLGAKGAKAIAAHKTDETDFGSGGDLPAGIEGGVAQLVDLKFDLYKKGDNIGQPFFYAAGIVVSPATFNGERIEGRRTSIGPIPLCDTPKAAKKKLLADHMADVLNELRKLGLDTSDLDDDPDALETAALALKEEGPHFKFRTWIGKATKEYPNPRVTHEWKGATEFDPDAQPGGGDEVEEAEGEVEESDDPLVALAAQANANDKAAQKELVKQAKAAGLDQKTIDNAEDWDAVVAMIQEASAGEEAVEEEATEEAGEDDLDALGAAADEGDDDAMTRLGELAEAAGLDPNDYPDSWTSLAEAIKEAGGETVEEEEVVEEEPAVPAKGEVMMFKPAGKPKAIEVEVVLVVAAKKLANVKDLAKGTLYKNVPFAKLTAPE